MIIERGWVIDNIEFAPSQTPWLRFPFLFPFEWVVNYRFEMFERGLR